MSALTADDPRHGSTPGFHAGCREACCRRAAARYEKEGRLARLHGGRAVPALGSQRRIRALVALGWSYEQVARAGGWAHRNQVRRIMVGQKGRACTWLERATARRVAQVYDELSMSLPEGRYADRTRRWARAQGWPPPLAWDDDLIDDPTASPAGTTTRAGWASSPPAGTSRDVDEAVVLRIMNGDPTVVATVHERRAAMARWLAAGRPEVALCRLMGWKAGRYVQHQALTSAVSA